jgi:hypothetical protein
MMYGLSPIYNDLKPYERIRYRVDDGGDRLIGYLSNFYYDGRDHWVAWRDDGLRCEYATRKKALADLLATDRSQKV